MTDRINENLHMSVPEQAAEWLLRWHCGDLSIADRFAYLQWLKTSPVHIAETLRMCRLYSWLESTKLKLFVTDPFELELELAARSYPVDTETLVRNALEERARRRRERSAWLAGVAAALVLVAVLLVWLPTSVPVTGITTRAGEWSTKQLDDGTEITLGPRSQARREYDEAHRTVVLESGEAFFKVTKDRRPFLVRTRLFTAQALGTRFGVSLAGSDDAGTVTVEEGRVAVSRHDHPTETLAVAAGEQLRVASHWPVAPQRVDAARELAWARKRLKFVSGDSLGRAVEEFNRRNVIQIEIDPALARRPVIGEFDASDPLSFAQTVVKQVGVVLSTSADTLHLEVDAPPPAETDRGARDDR